MSASKYLCRVVWGNGLTELVYGSGVVDPSDPEDRAVDAAVRAVRTRYETMLGPVVSADTTVTAVRDERGKLVTR